MLRECRTEEKAWMWRVAHAFTLGDLAIRTCCAAVAKTLGKSKQLVIPNSTRTGARGASSNSSE